jgi:hypothetical protein
MFLLLVAVSYLQDFETFYEAVNVFYADKIVNRTLGLGDTNNLACRSVDYELIFDGMAFLLAGV